MPYGIRMKLIFIPICDSGIMLISYMSFKILSDYTPEKHLISGRQKYKGIRYFRHIQKIIKMKAAVLTRYREFEVKEMPVREIQADEVLVRIEYASICGSDMHIFTGDFHPRTPVPFIPGHEMAGFIEKAGDSVKNFVKGEKVAIDPIIWCGSCPACPKDTTLPVPR